MYINRENEVDMDYIKFLYNFQYFLQLNSNTVYYKTYPGNHIVFLYLNKGS